MRTADLPIALTIGDPSGIGPELAAKVWLARRSIDCPPFYVIGDPAQLAARAKTIGLDIRLSEVEPARASSTFEAALPVMAMRHRLAETPGKPAAANSAGIVESIERAVADCFAGLASAVVTNPIAKKSLYDAGFAFPGHTEFLGHLAAQHTGSACQPVMMLVAPALRTVPVTIHIPLAAVSARLSSELIVSTVRIVVEDLAKRFRIDRPRLAVAGLNPHAGEDGSIGDEDVKIIQPAVDRLKADGIDIFGPLPADTMFHGEARAAYDAAICMYHDQALIPVKTLAFDETVNVTLGLPFIRTSPDHGTAFDIAGTGKARPGSLIAALKLGARLAASEPAFA